MALINCPECQKEVSEIAKMCPHCGYKMKDNKKIIAIVSVSVIVVLLIVFFIFKSGSASIIGEWKIDYYITEDGNIGQDDISKYYGEIYQTANSAFRVVFYKNGTVTLYLPTYEGTETKTSECEYEIDGDYIYLSAGGDTVKAFEIKGDTLIVHGVANFDGNAVLRKD